MTSILNPHRPEEANGRYKYTLSIEQPKEGYVTYFIDGEVANGRDTIYMTTQANIAPDNYQYPDCEGEQCLGCLIWFCFPFDKRFKHIAQLLGEMNKTL